MIARCRNELSHELIHFRHYLRNRKLISCPVTLQGHDGKTYVYSLREFIRQRAIFIHVPKTAGVSISISLFGNAAGGHRTALEYRRVFGWRFWKFFKFAFVRNPYSRLVSAYEYVRAGGHPAWVRDQKFGREVRENCRDFSDFVMKWISPDRSRWPTQHFFPQVKYLYLDGRCALDYLGRYETLQRDFSTVVRRLGGGDELPRLNRRQGSNLPVAAYYDRDRVVQRVRDCYQKDFEKLDYSLNYELAE